MRRHLDRSIRLLAAPMLLALWLIAAPTAIAGDPCYHDFEIPAVTTEATTQIKLADCAFGPTIARAPVGSTVTFFNGPNFTHLITGANQAWGSRDVEVQPNAEVSYKFAKAGIYAYACALHRGMSGAIVVGDASDALAAGTTGAGGATTDAGTAGGASEAAAAESSSSPSIGTLPLVAVGTIAGIVVGAGAAWLAVRRRTTRVEPLVRAE
jgi:plastocyanin